MSDPRTPFVLDASALLALLKREPEAAIVEGVLGDAMISTVNLAEVMAKLGEGPVSLSLAKQMIRGAGITVVPFSEEMAELSAELRPLTRAAG